MAIKNEHLQDDNKIKHLIIHRLLVIYEVCAKKINNE